ncbi:MAG: hypothetical protein RLZZ44_1725, partial [Bacteroidota bacterium]
IFAGMSEKIKFIKNEDENPLTEEINHNE